MWTKEFWKESVEHAIVATAAALSTYIDTDGVELNWETGWKVVAKAAATAILASIVASRVGQKGTASFVKHDPPEQK